MGKNFWLTSISAMVVACPALADPFPADGLMQPSMIYENAAVYDNTGVYEGVVEAIPVYEDTSVVCAAGQYLPANENSCATCPEGSYCSGGTFGYPVASNQGVNSCPESYPNSASGSTAMTNCYSNTKSRPWTGEQLNGTTPTGCSVTEWNSCSVNACDYVAYADATGNTDGVLKSGCATNNESCTQTVKSVSALNGYFAPNGATSCTACPGLTDGYNYVGGTGWTNFSQCKETKSVSSCAGGALTKTATSATMWGDVVSSLVAGANSYVNGTGDSATCTGCPTSHPNSEGGSNGMSQCYYSCPTKTVEHATSVTPVVAKIYYGAGSESSCAYNVQCAEDYVPVDNGTANPTCKKVVHSATCPAGQYLPANASSCATCPADSYCVGGTFEYPIASAQGIASCPAGQISASGSDASSDCHLPSTTCPAGKYLPANASSCTTCPADSYCVGGTFEYPIASAQGIASCPAGQISASGSDASSDCHLPSKTCPAGQYLPANASSCTTCPADSYCVGGTFEYPIASAQGIASCPAGKVAPIGSSFAGACGKVMHVGEDVLYLTSERQTLPALAAKIDGTVYYAKTTPGAKPMNGTTTKSLRTKIDGIEYSIHDNTAQGE